MKTLRFYKLVILALVLLNALTLIYLWQGNRRHLRPERNQLVEHLGIEGKAKNQVLILEDEHFKKKDQLIKKSRQLHEDLFRYFNNSSKDSADIAQKIDEIVENQREIERITFDYFKSIRLFCNQDQKKMLTQLIHEVLSHSAGPPRK